MTTNDAARLRAHFHAGDCWLFIASWLLLFDRRGQAFFKHVLARDDADGAMVDCDGRIFYVAAVNKRALGSGDLRRHLRAIGMDLSEGEIRDRDLLIVGPRATFETAVNLAETLFETAPEPRKDR